MGGDELMKKRNRTLPALAGFLRDARAGAVGLPSVMLSLIILMGVAGVGDMVGMYYNRGLLQAAMDAGSIAAVRELPQLDPGLTEDEVAGKLKPVITRYILSNVPEGIRKEVEKTLEISFTPDRDDGLVVVEVKAELGNGSVIGAQFWGPVAQKIEIDVAAKHVVVPVDVVLALDVSASMTSKIGRQRIDPTRIRVVKNAAAALLDALSAGAGNDGHVSVGLVPFNVTVNIGTNRQAWVSDVGAGHKANTALVERFSSFDFGPWQGCIEHRAKTNDLDLSLVTPEEEPFTSWFYPNSEDYRPLEREKLGEWTVGDNDWSTSTTMSILNRAVGPHKGCPDPMIPLTADLDRVKGAVENLMIPLVGGTQTHVGIVWGRRVLADAWRGQWALTPTPDAGPKRKKVLVLLSDGINEIDDPIGTYPGKYRKNLKGEYTSDYNGYGRAGKGSVEEGYLKDGRMWGMANEKQAEGVLAELFKESCKRAKDDGITVFTVSAVPRHSGSRKRLQEQLTTCATSEQHAFVENSTPELMKNAFLDIARRLFQFRLVKN